MNDKIKGYIFTILAFFLWGIFIVFWKFLKKVSPFELIEHRIIWSFCFTFIICYVTGRVRKIIPGLTRKKIIFLVLGSVLICSNWLVYIISINSGKIVEASLGYYITPLMNIFIGSFIFKEKLNKYQKAAFLLAATGVVILTVLSGSFPFIALFLAITFSTYGYVKKTSELDSLSGLMIETLIAFPFALVFLFFSAVNNNVSFTNSGLFIDILILSTGIITAVPLILFAKGAKRIPLSSVGFLQYLAPTIALLLAVFVYHEVFGTVHLISYGLIWIALIISSVSLLVPYRIKKSEKKL